NARIAARLELVDLLGIGFLHHLALRGSASTGFRAPSLAQIHYNTVFTDVQDGKLIDKVVAPNSGELARAAGIPSLREEKSKNASVGVTAEAGPARVTVDGYVVDITDRIVLTGHFDTSDPDLGPLLSQMQVGAAQFFANALDTRTFGVDVVVDGAFEFGEHQL